MKSVSPINYELTFEPDFKKFTFRGKEKISIKITKPTNKITLHAAELEINQCKISHNGKEVRPKIILDKKTEEMVLVFSGKISGNAILSIDFTGQLNDKLVGFYRSKYKYKGKEKYLATTQFEAADARRAFPCWDEPEAKATFDVSLLVDNNHTAISNMPVISKRIKDQKTLYKFDTTPIMSTYLLYLAVGEFESISSRSGKTLIRVITTQGKKHQGKLSLEFTKQFLSYFERYFKIAYPLPKLDMIAIPDFASGAMENWGAITFRETILLYDPKTSSTETKQHIAEVIAHEIAHQWFGNLVTMKWWNDLWLNESFATFMATKAVDALYPEWDFWDQFLISEMTGGLSLDSLKSSHPIDVPVKSPSDVRQIFDEISYNKGGCVLMMLENFIGDDSFRKGLHSYLKNHEYANATTEDLWNSLGKISRQPVRQMMDTWVRQVGYPIIEANVKDSKLRLSQSRFLLENNKKTKQGNWIIPLSGRPGSKTVTKLMKGPVTIPYKADWFKVNEGQKGFYRVKYDKDARDALGTQIEEKTISNVDRWSIHHDLFALCMSGQVSFTDYLDFVKHYEDEDDYVVLSDIISSLNFFYTILANEQVWDEIKKFNLDFFNKVFARLGWNQSKGEKSTTALLRSQIISSLGRLEDKEVVAEAKSRFSNLLKTGNLNPDLRGPVYSIIAWTGDSSTYQKMLSLYRKAQTQEEMVRLLSSLANFQDTKLLSKTLLFTLSKEVRTQNLFQPIARMVTNPQGKELVWPWIKQNWKGIVSRFGVGNPLLNRIIGSVSIENDFEKEIEIKKFFTRHHVPGTEMKLAQTLERIRIHARFSQRVRKEFR
ncbi:MAG TPA: M1 family metallopeptidase [Candidatus Nitrosotalea sp.]|nr:M1 family metallopeptidase [Candidatus Nitrosotalea sp.]